MNTKKNQEINKRNDIKLSNQFEKSLNLSNSEESYEEYTPKELSYIDKYKAMALNRLTDDEVYDIVCKYNFNDEKIEREIKEFTKLILNKGDDYSWTIIDTGKKKKLFINESESKKRDERTDRYNKKYNTGGNYTYYSNKGGYYDSNRSNYKNRTFKKYQQEVYPSEEAHLEGVENLNADEEKDGNQNNNYYQGNYYGTRGYTRGRGRQRGRGRGRGNYSYNYRFKEDYVIEKELNPTNQEANLSLKPENLESSEKPATGADQNVDTQLIHKEPSPHISPKKHLNPEAAEEAQKADLHKSPVANIKNISNSDSEYAVENFLSSNENNNNNKLNKESPQKQTSASKNISNIASQENAHVHTEKSTIFINNAIPNTNQSKLTNLFETNKEKELPSKKTANESDLHPNRQEKLNITANTQHSISTASNLEFNSKPNQTQQNIHNITPQQANNNLNKNLIQESSNNITFTKTVKGKFEDNVISVENNSFGVFSAPKKENVVSSHQAHNFTFTAQAPPQQNKFTPVASSATNKNVIIPNNPVNANQNLNQGQIPNLSNLSNLNKPNSQQQLNNKNETGNNPLNLNMSPNMQFNPMMPTPNMQSELSALYQFAGANPLQQGLYPMFWCYPPTQGGNLDQYPGAAASAGANAQMPFIPYPMAYYVNPYTYGQQETNKDAENASNVNAKARKNNSYANVSSYHGMNPNESNNQQTAATQGIPNAYGSPYMYFNSQFPSSGINQMMGMNSTPNAAWNNPYMNPMGLNMPGQMNVPSYENPNYNNMKSNEQANPNNLFQYKFLNQN